MTGLGKWWGRKPLVLVRAIVLGLLLPSSDDPAKDRETFLALMTMDDEGMWRRLDKNVTAPEVYDLSTRRERDEYFAVESGKPRWKPEVSSDDRKHLQRRAFLRMGYDRRLSYCKRPEHIEGPDMEAWERINDHLGTTATSLTELVDELGKRRFGRTPRVGDAFCGGGSIPFEAARLGCKAYGTDLNPVAALLTWGALNVVGGGQEAVDRVKVAQRRVFEAVKQQVDDWGIERNEKGWIADAYLYCNEVYDPATGWRVPLAPSWVIAPKNKVVARLVPDSERRRFVIEIAEGVSANELSSAANEGTWSGGVRSPVDRDGTWLKPIARQATSVEQLRGHAGLRRWDSTDLVPRTDDVFKERLYCIRWLDPETGLRHYRAPTESDLEREQRVLELLQERFDGWQIEGYIPSRRIEPGKKTDEPIRTRGWTYWHQLFTPRQLLLAGLFSERINRESGLDAQALLLMLGRVVDANSRLSRWQSGQGGGIGGSKNTFDNQALNTLLNYGCRTIATLESAFCAELKTAKVHGSHHVALSDARAVEEEAEIWITDPGYGDMILYDELSEYFLAWYDQRLPELFPGWYSDSKRALTVKGEGEQFRLTLARCYQHLAEKMSNDGFQVVMFTHQDPEVWADLALVLWSANLQVTAAWTVATETGATGIKAGNYVQGTVIMLLRKRRGELRGEMVDLYPEIRAEVQDQLETMLALDPEDDPNFGDTDYQLAAYAAALRVLTGYNTIGDIDVERELRRQRERGETSPVVKLIQQAVRIASDVLVPEGFDGATWRKLVPEERLYLKGIELEAQGEAREGVYQELARGYGASEYRALLASRSANQTRVKTPSEFRSRDLKDVGAAGFDGTLLRQVLFAVYKTATDPERDPRSARQYLRQELPEYWGARQSLIELLRYLATKPERVPHWEDDAKAARLLLGSVESDAV